MSENSNQTKREWVPYGVIVAMGALLALLILADGRATRVELREHAARAEQRAEEARAEQRAEAETVRTELDATGPVFGAKATRVSEHRRDDLSGAEPLEQILAGQRREQVGNILSEGLEAY